MLSKTWRSAVAAAAVVLVVAGCGASGDDDNNAAAEPQAAAEQSGQDDQSADSDQGAGQSADGPDVSNIPDPVAEVNGTGISRDEFVSVFENQYQQMSMQAQMTGQPVDEEQLKKVAADGLVGTVLLEQEAQERGLEVNDSEVDAELAKYAETNQVSTDEFISAMGEQGLDRQAVLEQIQKQLLVQKLIVDEYGEPEITDAQIEEAYQQVAQQQAAAGGQAGAGQPGGGQVPPLEEVRDQVEEQLRAEQQAQSMETLSQELREDADVTVHL